jgi:hypothetical protein
MRCFVTAGKHVNNIRATSIARYAPIATTEKMSKEVFSVKSVPELYNENTRPAQWELREFSCVYSPDRKDLSVES